MKTEIRKSNNLINCLVIILTTSIFMGCSLTSYFAKEKKVDPYTTAMRLESKISKFKVYKSDSKKIENFTNASLIERSFAPDEDVENKNKYARSGYTPEMAEKLISNTIYLVMYQFDNLEDAKKYFNQEVFEKTGKASTESTKGKYQENISGENYEIKFTDVNSPKLGLGSLSGTITCHENAFCYSIASRKENPALQTAFTTEFLAALPESLALYETK